MPSSRSGTSGRVSPDNVSWSRTVTTPPPRSPRPARRSRDRRPRDPSRFPLDALTLTASRSRRSSVAMASASRRGGRPGAAGRRRSSGRPMPGASRRPRPGHGPRPGAQRWGSRAGSGCPPGRGARDRPGRRPRAARRRERGGRRRRRNGQTGAARPSITIPPSARGSPGPNGWLSCPIPTRVVGGPASIASTRRRSAGWVTLRLLGSPGTTWTGILQASRRAASSVHVVRAVGRERP